MAQQSWRCHVDGMLEAGVPDEMVCVLHHFYGEYRLRCFDGVGRDGCLSNQSAKACTVLPAADAHLELSLWITCFAPCLAPAVQICSDLGAEALNGCVPCTVTPMHVVACCV